MCPFLLFGLGSVVVLIATHNGRILLFEITDFLSLSLSSHILPQQMVESKTRRYDPALMIRKAGPEKGAAAAVVSTTTKAARPKSPSTSSNPSKMPSAHCSSKQGRVLKIGSDVELI
jgi:hypothetical protein